MADPIRLPVSMLFHDGDGPESGHVYAEVTDPNEVAVHQVPTAYSSRDADTAYLDPISAAALGQQLLTAAQAALVQAPD